MNVAPYDITSLQKDVKRLQKHQQEIDIIRGETFNIFSILGVESRENKTHSNFIAELLNPYGSHLMGTIFLKLFLSQINYEGDLDPETAVVIKEFHISKREDVTGGRIDILIKDASQNLISIENKIYAGDQENQLIRYHNYSKEKNTLYYLSLEGEAATDISTIHKDEQVDISLENGVDYYTLSYSNDILEWLIKCQQLAVDVPQLRASIKQYLLLIKKLTNQMVDNRAEMAKVLFQNPDASQYISDNFTNFKNHLKYEFREEVKRQLQSQLGNNFSFKTPNSVTRKSISQIFVRNNNLNDPNARLEFLIESFSGFGHHDNQVFIGVLDLDGKHSDHNFDNTDHDFRDEHWRSAKYIEIDKQRIRFEDLQFLKSISEIGSDRYNRIVASFVKQCLEFITLLTPIMEQSYKELKV